MKNGNGNIRFCRTKAMQMKTLTFSEEICLVVFERKSIVVKPRIVGAWIHPHGVETAVLNDFLQLCLV